MSTQNTSTDTQTKTSWNIDASHSDITFSARHMLISNVKGKFEDYAGVITTEGYDLETAKVDLKIKVASISTGAPDRDNHLRSDDFFNSEKFPEIQIKSTSIKSKGGDEYEMNADVTIRDITKPVTFTIEKTGHLPKDPWGLERLAVEVNGKLNRFDFDLKWNALIETGGAVVGSDIKLHANIELIKQQNA